MISDLRTHKKTVQVKIFKVKMIRSKPTIMTFDRPFLLTVTGTDSSVTHQMCVRPQGSQKSFKELQEIFKILQTIFRYLQTQTRYPTHLWNFKSLKLSSNSKRFSLDLQKPPWNMWTFSPLSSISEVYSKIFKIHETICKIFKESTKILKHF